jgi:hypothetical protein
MVSLSLSAGLFDPIIGPSGWISTVANLGYDALKTSLAGVRVHLAAIDFKALAELDFGLGNQALEECLALE